jgi:hypothetical protein
LAMRSPNFPSADRSLLFLLPPPPGDAAAHTPGPARRVRMTVPPSFLTLPAFPMSPNRTKRGRSDLAGLYWVHSQFLSCQESRQVRGREPLFPRRQVHGSEEFLFHSPFNSNPAVNAFSIIMFDFFHFGHEIGPADHRRFGPAARQDQFHMIRLIGHQG